MVEWTVAEIAQAAKTLGLSPGKVRQMAGAGVLDKTKALNGQHQNDDHITLAQASEEFGVSKSCLHGWIDRGKLDEKGRTFGVGPGGLVLVSRQQVADVMAAPPNKGGRPRKLPS